MLWKWWLKYSVVVLISDVTNNDISNDIILSGIEMIMKWHDRKKSNNIDVEIIGKMIIMKSKPEMA